MSNDLSFNFGSRFTFFAMGDSSYPKFNWVGLSMARRFEARFGNLQHFRHNFVEFFFLVIDSSDLILAMFDVIYVKNVGCLIREFDLR